MEQLIKVMMQLIKYEVCGVPMEELDTEVLSDDFLKALYHLSKSHDLVHIVASALEKQGLLSKSDVGEKISKQVFTAVYRYQQAQYTYQKICAIFDDQRIAYVPLKGAVIREYYPEPWMRTSCDIDILIRQEDLERAVEVLSAKIGFTQPPHKNFHDISLFLNGNTHLELHYNIKESMASMDGVLETVWDYVERVNDTQYLYLQRNEYLIFHLVAHSAYHFMNGGCGIRPLLDFWLLRKKLPYDSEKLNELLEKAKLKTFETQMTALSDVWFSDAAHTSLTREMEAYILGAGVYGTLENKVAIASEQSQSRFHYFFKRVFRPYHSLKQSYSLLEKWPILYPYYTVKRWGRILFGKNRKKAFHEIKYTATVTNDKSSRLAKMCNDLNLTKE